MLSDFTSKTHVSVLVSARRKVQFPLVNRNLTLKTLNVPQLFYQETIVARLTADRELCFSTSSVFPLVFIFHILGAETFTFVFFDSCV
jgi:hypothetical protein